MLPSSASKSGIGHQTALCSRKPARLLVTELIGHDSAQMSEPSTHVGQEAMRKAAEALPNLIIATKE